jgi:hypothetical protein
MKIITKRRPIEFREQVDLTVASTVASTVDSTVAAKIDLNYQFISGGDCS